MHEVFVPVELSAAMDPTATLSGDDRLLVDRVLRRLHEAMRDFWNGWPIADRSASALSRILEVDRTTCQRLSSLAREQYRGELMLESLPGPRALRNVIDAASQHIRKRRGGAEDAGSSANVLDALRAAVDALDELLQEHGGTLSQLKRKLTANAVNDAAARRAAIQPPPPPPETAAAATPPVRSTRDNPQQSLFEAAAQITGRHSRATASIGLYDKFGVADNELRHIRISGNHGVVAQPHAVPMVLEAFDSDGDRPDLRAFEEPGDRDAEPPASDTRWQRTPALLHEFTSAEWRSVLLRPSPGFASRAMEIARSQTPSDVYVYTAFPVPDPRTLDEPIEESWFILYNPTASLIFDLYLHESIARRCLLTLDVHLWQTSFANHPHGRWHTRLPHAPRIVQLGRPAVQPGAPGDERNRNAPYSLQASAVEQHPLHGRLTEELFRIAGANPAEYVGFRCEEQYPIWRAGYRYELDFGE